MKFLKTFLFTISLTFISFGVVTLSGFCEAAPVLTPDTSSFQVIQGGGMPYYYGMQGYGEMWFMGEEFNTTFMNDLAGAMQDGQNYVVSQGYSLPTNGWGGADLALANRLSNLFSKGVMDFAQMTAQGYTLISHSAPQWGSLAKEYFIGKVDETTGVISDAVGNLVTKVTQEGINNYLGYSNQFVTNGTVQDVSNLSFKYGRVIEFPLCSSNGVVQFPLVHIEFPSDTLVVTQSSSTPTDVWVLCDSNQSVNGFYINNSGQKTNFNSISQYTSGDWWFTLPDGTRKMFGYFYVGGYEAYTLGNYFSMPSGYTSRFAFARDFFANNPSSPEGYLYKYSSGTSLALQNLLNQLIGKYVDSNIFEQINDKIAQAPIIIEYQNNEPVPVAEPSSDLLDEIGDLIDEAIANSLVYQQLLEPLEESEPEPEPEPDSEPNNQGTAVPEDFPTTIFSPINDSVGSIFDFVSIFEPLFYVFSFSAGLLGLWIVVPFVILFLILFRLLK